MPATPPPPPYAADAPAKGFSLRRRRLMPTLRRVAPDAAPARRLLSPCRFRRFHEPSDRFERYDAEFAADYRLICAAASPLLRHRDDSALPQRLEMPPLCLTRFSYAAPMFQPYEAIFFDAAFRQLFR